jgi:hypothetical protein
VTSFEQHLAERLHDLTPVPPVQIDPDEIDRAVRGRHRRSLTITITGAVLIVVAGLATATVARTHADAGPVVSHPTPTPPAPTPPPTPRPSASPSSTRPPSEPPPATGAFAGVILRLPAGWSLVQSTTVYPAQTFRVACAGPPAATHGFALPGTTTCAGGVLIFQNPHASVRQLIPSEYAGEVKPGDRCGSAPFRLLGANVVRMDALPAAYSERQCGDMTFTRWRQWLLLDRALAFVEEQPDHGSTDRLVDQLMATTVVNTPRIS